MLLAAHRVAVAMSDMSVFQEGELSLAEWAILRSLRGRQGVPLKEIAQTSGVSRQRIRKLVSELEAKGLVSTSRSKAADKRVRLISAAPLAASVLSSVSAQIQALLPESGKAGRARPLSAAARQLHRTAKAARRTLKKSSQAGKQAQPADDLDDDD
jgi:DNA-binding MarR family transcriptional regulator